MSRVFTGASGNYLSYVGAMGISSDPVTLFAWIKLATTSSGMVCTYENTSSHYIALSVLSGAIRTLIQQEYGGEATTSGTASTDVWVPITATYTDGTVANVRALTEEVNGGFCGAFQTPATPGFSIGSMIRDTALVPIDGKVAHVTLWSSELSDPDVASLVGGADPSTIATGSLIEYWALTGASLVGLNGRTLTVNGTVSSDTGDNPTVGGGGGSTASSSLLLMGVG